MSSRVAKLKLLKMRITRWICQLEAQLSIFELLTMTILKMAVSTNNTVAFVSNYLSYRAD